MRSFTALLLTVCVAAFVADHVSAIGQCPSGYTLVAGGCYQVVHDKTRNFQDSRDKCLSKGGDLAVLRDCHALGHISAFIYEQGYPQGHGFWVGATDANVEGRFVWLDHNVVQPGAPFWAGRKASGKYEPSGGPNENCLCMPAADGFYFHDCVCDSDLNHAMCEIKTPQSVGTCPYAHVSIGGSCFYFSDTVQSWNESRSICHSMNSDLAAITDCNVMGNIVNFVSNFGGLNHTSPAGFWLGGSDAADEGNWTYLDGSPVPMGTPYWGRAHEGQLEPDNDKHSENCLTLWANDRFYFNDQDCAKEDALFPLCEADPIL